MIETKKRYELLNNDDHSIIIIDGFKVIVDSRSVPELIKWHWSVKRVDFEKRGEGPYFKRHILQPGKTPHRTTGMLHRFLMGEPKGMIVDHKNGNTLDNRVSNLRIVDDAASAKNRRIRSSLFEIRGIHKTNSKPNPYMVCVRVNKKLMYIGSFHKMMVAEYELMKALDKYHGEHSRYKLRVNFNDTRLL